MTLLTEKEKNWDNYIKMLEDDQNNGKRKLIGFILSCFLFTGATVRKCIRIWNK